jgi:IS1 family transposase
MRKLNVEKRAAILGCLIEGMSVRATMRLTGAAQNTVLRLLADAGRVATDYHDRTVRELSTTLVQCDEAWGFVGCKDKQKKRGAKGYGSAWTWVAQDADSKLVVSWIVGQRDGDLAEALLKDVAERIPGKLQISSDAFNAYPTAVTDAFPADENGEVRVDLGVVVKTYASPVKEEARRYSPSVCIGCVKEAKIGEPDMDEVSTSYIENQNRQLRMRCRRMTRLTDAFSKSIANHASATALHYFAFNFITKHGTLKTTPAVAAGIATRPLTTLDLAKMIEAEEAAMGGRVTSYLPWKPTSDGSAPRAA